MGQVAVTIAAYVLFARLCVGVVTFALWMMSPMWRPRRVPWWLRDH